MNAEHNSGWREDREEAARRLAYREKGEYTMADVLRDQLEHRGWQIEDLGHGRPAMYAEEWMGRRCLETLVVTWNGQSSRLTRRWRLIIDRP